MIAKKRSVCEAERQRHFRTGGTPVLTRKVFKSGCCRIEFGMTAVLWRELRGVFVRRP